MSTQGMGRQAMTPKQIARLRRELPGKIIVGGFRLPVSDEAINVALKCAHDLYRREHGDVAERRLL